MRPFRQITSKQFLGPTSQNRRVPECSCTEPWHFWMSHGLPWHFWRSHGARSYDKTDGARLFVLHSDMLSLVWNVTLTNVRYMYNGVAAHWDLQSVVLLLLFLLLGLLGIIDFSFACCCTDFGVSRLLTAFGSCLFVCLFACLYTLNCRLY